MKGTKIGEGSEFLMNSKQFYNCSYYLYHKQTVTILNNFIIGHILPIYHKQTETILKVKGTVDKVSNPPLKELNVKRKKL